MTLHSCKIWMQFVKQEFQLLCIFVFQVKYHQQSMCEKLWKITSGWLLSYLYTWSSAAWNKQWWKTQAVSTSRSTSCNACELKYWVRVGVGILLKSAEAGCFSRLIFFCLRVLNSHTCHVFLFEWSKPLNSLNAKPVQARIMCFPLLLLRLLFKDLHKEDCLQLQVTNKEENSWAAYFLHHSSRQNYLYFRKIICKLTHLILPLSGMCCRSGKVLLKPVWY